MHELKAMMYSVSEASVVLFVGIRVPVGVRMVAVHERVLALRRVMSTRSESERRRTSSLDPPSFLRTSLG